VPEPQARPETPRGFYLAMAELMRRVEHSRQGNTDLTASELRVTSQNGEDGVIAELLRRIGTSPDPYFVEFGVEDGSEGNCVFLADALGWSGLFLELDPDQYARLAAKYRWSTGVSTVAAKVAPATVESLFSQSDVPLEPDVLSIDVDGADYWSWRAITNYRPRLVIIEYNAELEPEDRQVVPENLRGVERHELLWRFDRGAQGLGHGKRLRARLHRPHGGELLLRSDGSALGSCRPGSSAWTELISAERPAPRRQHRTHVRRRPPLQTHPLIYDRRRGRRTSEHRQRTRTRAAFQPIALGHVKG